MHDLALQIGQIDPVVVDDAERADPGGGEIEQQRRAEPAGADHQHARRQQLFLPLLADLVEDQMAGVAPELLFAQFHRDVLPEAGPHTRAPAHITPQTDMENSAVARVRGTRQILGLEAGMTTYNPSNSAVER